MEQLHSSLPSLLVHTNDESLDVRKVRGLCLHLVWSSPSIASLTGVYFCVLLCLGVLVLQASKQATRRLTALLEFPSLQELVDSKAFDPDIVLDFEDFMRLSFCLLFFFLSLALPLIPYFSCSRCTPWLMSVFIARGIHFLYRSESCA